MKSLISPWPAFQTRLLASLLLLSLVSCNLPGLRSSPAQTATKPPEATLTAGLPLPEQVQITFNLLAPADLPPDQPIFLVLLDEVTGLALNTQPYRMNLLPASEAQPAPQYQVSLPLPLGALVRYRYERLNGSVRLAEHLADGSPVRYRQLLVNAPGAVSDIVSRWVDTPYHGGLGRIYGIVREAGSQQPLPGLLVTAGGAQTFTRADGSFRLEGMPPGVHNLVVSAPDGAYQTFQQGACVAAGAITPALVSLAPAQIVRGMFVVSLPEGTLPVIPLRMAGNLSQLGNTFADLTGGMNLAANRMPVLRPLPDGRYTITLNLPAGADLRYKYTLGDGFWNAERTRSGAIRLRQIIVPNENFAVEDSVESWSDAAGNAPALSFDLQAPADTPPDEFLAIQFAPLFGWTEPIPMWSLGNGRWAYVLYNPLGLPGSLRYRYCRNGQCTSSDSAELPDIEGAGRSIDLANPPALVSDQLNSWSSYQAGIENLLTAESAAAMAATARPRPAGFRLGVALTADYHPSWQTLLPNAFGAIRSLGANTVIISPTWNCRNWTPGYAEPFCELQAGRDILWNDLLEIAAQARGRNLAVWLYPSARLEASDNATWWLEAQRDEIWWETWFSEYRQFILHHAELAKHSSAQALILGGDWLEPALPGGNLPNGQPSGVPPDAEARWRELLTEVRSHFGGSLYWAISRQQSASPPPFLDQVNGLIVEWTVLPDETGDPGGALNTWLDQTGWALYAGYGTSLLLAPSLPAQPDAQAQVAFYQAFLEQVNLRDWISGVIAFSFAPTVRQQGSGPNLNGQPTLRLLQGWFQAWSQP